MGKGQADPDLGLAVPGRQLASATRRPARSHQGRCGRVFRHSPWLVRLHRQQQRAVGGHAPQVCLASIHTSASNPCSTPTSRCCPRSARMRHVHVVTKDWRRRSLPDGYGAASHCTSTGSRSRSRHVANTGVANEPQRGQRLGKLAVTSPNESSIPWQSAPDAEFSTRHSRSFCSRVPQPAFFGSGQAQDFNNVRSGVAGLRSATNDANRFSD
jgi:hypothetical protein